MRSVEHDIRRTIAAKTAKLIFTLALLFLLGQSVLVVLWTDVPMMLENAIAEVEPDSLQAQKLQQELTASVLQQDFQSATVYLMLFIWPVIALESAFHWLTRPWDRPTAKYHFYGLLICICPSLRLCARSPEMGERIWLPTLGWRNANRRLRRRLERTFSVPMIFIALLILPVLIIGFFMKSQVAQYAWLRFALHVSTGTIWFAFAAEFILMVSVAEKKLDYCKKHWIDLAIILLPFISFLRSLRVLRASQAAKLLRASQISKFARVYRLRGTAVKAFRALILLELFQRLSAGRQHSIKKMQRRLVELEDEARELRRNIKRLQKMERQREQRDAAEETNLSGAVDDDDNLESPLPFDGGQTDPATAPVPPAVSKDFADT